MALSGGILGYQPMVKQASFHGSRARTRLYLGGNASGKTTAGAAELVMVATGTHPVRSVPDPLSGVVAVPAEGAVLWQVALDYGMLRDVQERALFELMPPEFIESWDRLNHILKLKNGTVIYGKSADAGRDKFQGAAVHGCWIDEEFQDYEIMREIVARTFRVRGDIWITATPLRGFSKLLYEDIYAPWEAGEVHRDKWGVADVDVIQSFSSENTYLDPDEIARSARAFSEEERVSRLFGMFSQPTGRVFPEFVPSLHVVGREQMGEVERHWPVVIGMDVGAGQSHTAAYLMVLRDDGVVLVLKEYYQASGCPLTEHVVGLRLLAGVAADGTGRMPMVHLDRTARQFAIDLASHGIPVAKSKSDHMSGFSRIREALAGDDDGNVGLVIAAECRHLVQDLPRYAWKEPVAGSDGMDRVKKKSDHSIDAFRYGLMALPHRVVLKRQSLGASINQRVAERYRALIRSRDGSKKLRDSYGHDGLG